MKYLSILLTLAAGVSYFGFDIEVFSYGSLIIFLFLAELLSLKSEY